MRVSELATMAVTGDKVAQVAMASLSTRDIIAMMIAEHEEES
jgi:hypothetical protein